MKILLADDHQIFRESMILLLSFEDDIEVVGQASNGQGVLEALKSGARPNLLLTDIAMQGMGGVETTRLVKQNYPDIKVLVLSMNSERENILGAMEAGADGYVLKSAGKSEVLMAIRAVNEGNSYFSHEVTTVIVSELNQNHKKTKSNDSLSEREREVLSLIAKQLSSVEIAKQLFISARTVEAHRRNMLEKLGLKNTAGLMKYALEKGLVK